MKQLIFDLKLKNCILVANNHTFKAMNIFNKINFYSLSNYLPSIPFSSLAPQLKKILIIASLAIGFLAASYALIKCRQIKARPVVDHALINMKLLEDPVTTALRGLHNSNCSGIVHGIYLSTNETDLQVTRDFLTATPTPNQGCHIGCAGWHNFDIMATRMSAYGLILDFNPQNKRLIEATLSVITHSSTREEFATKMGAYLDRGLIKFCHKSPPLNQSLTAKEEMMIEFNREGSWLSKEETYQYIRSLALNDKIAAITEDIRNTRRFVDIPELLNQFGITIDTIYLSNICIFMKDGEDKQAFASTLQTLIDPNTIVINCPSKTEASFAGENISNPLQQFAMLGGEFQGDQGEMKFFIIDHRGVT